VREVMSELEREAYERYDGFVARALDEMAAAGAEVWTAPAEEWERIMQPRYNVVVSVNRPVTPS
jgi:hypothetical protein